MAIFCVFYLYTILFLIGFPLWDTLLFFISVVFPAQAEYSYFSADFRLKIFFYYSSIKPSAVFVFARFCYLKRKEFVIILFCGLVCLLC